MSSSPAEAFIVIVSPACPKVGESDPPPADCAYLKKSVESTAKFFVLSFILPDNSLKEGAGKTSCVEF